MGFTAKDVEKLMAEVRAKSPNGLGAMPPKHAEKMVSGVVGETTTTIKAIEDRIAEAGCLPGDVSGILLHYGAVAAILEDLPETDPRRELVLAGREIGKAIAEKFGEKIRQQLDTQSGKDN